MQDIHRLRRGQDVGASWRCVKCAKASAGQRSGTSGTTSGQGARQGAFAAAAVRVRRAHPAGPQARTRWETTYGPGTALTIGAPPGARAVSARFPRHTACAMDPWLRRSGSGAREPDAALASHGLSLHRALCPQALTAAVPATERRGLRPCSLRLAGPLAPAAGDTALVAPGATCTAPPPRWPLTGARSPCRRCGA